MAEHQTTNDTVSLQTEEYQTTNNTASLQTAEHQTTNDTVSLQTEKDIHAQFKEFVKEGMVQYIRDIIQDVDIDYQFLGQDETALWMAASKGDKNMVRLLMEYKANVDLSNHLGQSPLWIACKNGHTETAKLLLKFADVNLKDRDGKSPLWAVTDSHHQDRSTIMLLLEQENIDVNSQDRNGQCPLQVTTREGNVAECKCLMMYRADPDMKDTLGRSSVWTAAFYGHLDILKTFVRYKNSVAFDAVDNEQWSSIFAAASQGHTDIVKYLLQHGVDGRDEDINGYSPIEIAARYEKEDTFLVLLELENSIHDTNIFEYCRWLGLDTLAILHLAIQRDDIPLLKGTLDAGADKDLRDKQGYTVLHRSMQSENTQAMEILLNCGCDVNIANKEGSTPLFTAIFGNSSVNKISELLTYGTSVNHRDLNGVKPLQLALEKGQADVILLLLENNATADLVLAADMGTIVVVQKLMETMTEDINKKDIKGETPLHKACAKNKLDIVQHLVANGALIDVVNVFGRTPLHTALIACSWDVVHYLLTRDNVCMCINYKDYNGWNALHLAVREGTVDISKILMRYCPHLSQEKDCFGKDVDTFISRGKRKYHKDETDNGDILQSIEPQNILLELVNISPSYGINQHKSSKCYDDAHNLVADIRNVFEQSINGGNTR